MALVGGPSPESLSWDPEPCWEDGMETPMQVNRRCSWLSPPSAGDAQARDVDLPALNGEPSDTRQQRGLNPTVSFLNS